MTTTPRQGERLRDTASVVHAIREAILVGEFNPGQRLIESELSQRFSASRGTVREALALLGNEGLAVREVNRGARVRPVSKEEAIEITEVRAVLEGLCARRAATRATAAERKELRELGTTMQAAVKRGDIMTYSQVSQDVHLRIRELSGQSTAADVLNRLRFRSVRYQFSVALLPGRPAEGLKEHLGVIKAVVAGQADLAETVMREHLESVIEAISQLPESLPTMHVG
ncbi:DNA-binding GntR family transcriptional regulator [Asanoa ferruginea]|uniref:DNA-binding GntR family transcriptional regulator n=1 Tax=Asanoa ferruginea TaxID=53367 RepID=A0A3D9ZPI5_9ACTN|nr:GntR family transcriptional regulator [Asanoa ferruginea]REF99181.1 DNA-binding GntR family transcriptional regulator [Asanoa ferruginea]GIF45772.1 GntR family transcriptional regulator [Asanoa ferruginea]